MPKKPLTLVRPAGSDASIPPGLGKEGAALFRSVMEEYGIRDRGGLLVLAQCAAAADMIARLLECIDRDGLTVEMASGRRSHPLLKDLLGHRAFLVSGLNRLGVVDAPTKQMGSPYKKYGTEDY